MDDKTNPPDPNLPHMSTLQDRFKLALEHRKAMRQPGEERVTQAALARHCDRAKPTVRDWFVGKTMELRGDNLLKAAQYLRVRPAWLSNGRGPMALDANDPAASAAQEIADIYTAGLSPMAAKLGRMLDDIPDETLRIDAFAACVAVLENLKRSIA